ncbi:MAG TPA: hydantoinase/oxoprolinase family protein [Gemmatimonadales bacterium]|nr:hydantoinase/oxoprolinase family protein [Gemmatimonadales bacterium]
MSLIIGWDVGGVNTKAVRVTGAGELRAALEPFEMQRAGERLGALLAGLARRLEASPDARHAVTMTAELSQFFRTKREGVAYVLDAFRAVAPPERIHVFGTDGRFHAPADARRRPLLVSASNWAATAQLVASAVPDAILIDIGSTTTDIIPIADGVVCPVGRTDPDRLASGELVYTGALRTPVEAIVSRVPLGRGSARVAAEGFANSGDVHLWLGRLAPSEYTSATPDGRPATREFARERLARVVCADREMLDDDAIDAIAWAVAEAQVRTVAEGIAEVRARHPAISLAVITGVGDFIAEAAAHRAGLGVLRLAERLGAEAARTAPAAAVALLLAREQGAVRS